MPRGISAKTGRANIAENKHPLTRKDSQKGGKARAEAARERKVMREVFAAVLDMPLKESALDDIQCLAGSKKKNVTVSQAIALAMARDAIDGNVQAATFLRDTSGNKPKDEIEISRPDSETVAAMEAYFAKRKPKKK